jgi:ribosomal subunit interface protein
MDIVLNSRHCELSDRFRGHVEEKLARLEKHDHRVIRVEVEVEAERNPRQSDRAVRVELTAFSKGPVIRAEAAADDKMSALDLALDRIDRQLVAFKEKVTHRKQSASPVRVPPAGNRPAQHSPEPERLRLKLRPMSEAEAISELQADGQPCVVYLNEDSGEIQILVRRADGSLAVIEPVVP